MIDSFDPKTHLYLYAIVRRDIQMSTGKLAAQTGHAFTDSIHTAHQQQPQRVNTYHTPGHGGTKITLGAPRLEDLLCAYAAAKASQIPCAIIVDRHHIHPPDFDGSPIITALGIGPCTKQEARPICGRLKLIN